MGFCFVLFGFFVFCLMLFCLFVVVVVLLLFLFVFLGGRGLGRICSPLVSNIWSV